MPKLDDLSLIRQLRADQDAYQQVARALEMQRTFVADVSHELRTPLITLRGNLGLLARRPPIPAEEQSDILTDMTDESDRLIRLVRVSTPIVPILEEACCQARQLDPEREISLEAD